MEYDTQGILLVVLGVVLIFFRKKIINLQLDSLTGNDRVNHSVRKELKKKYVLVLATIIGTTFIVIGFFLNLN